MKQHRVILVNEQDEPVGTMEKIEAHRKGLLHRAFSIFIFDTKGKMLLQQRAAKKYHGAHLWTNACCSHPCPDENTEQAAERRLKEELGFHTALQEIFSFTYFAHVENDLIEHEYDHVFTGEYEGEIEVDKNEVATYCYKDMGQLKTAIKEYPGKFTKWFIIAFPHIEKWWHQKYMKS